MKGTQNRTRVHEQETWEEHKEHNNMKRGEQWIDKLNNTHLVTVNSLASTK
jgi:hypothetical protein